MHPRTVTIASGSHLPVELALHTRSPAASGPRVRSILLGIAVTVGGLLSGGCERNNDPEQPATFDRVFEAFDSAGCADASCHGGATLQAELDLDDPVVAYEQLVDVECANPNADDAGMLRVSAGDPEASFLLTKLAMLSSDPALGLPMPPTGEALSDNDLDLVRRWIDAGAPPPGE